MASFKSNGKAPNAIATTSRQPSRADQYSELGWTQSATKAGGAVVGPRLGAVLILALGFVPGCGSSKGEDTQGNTPLYNVNANGTGGTGSGITSTVWPPDGFVNVTDVQYGAYALGPEIANDVSTTGSATISNDGTQCSGLYGVIRDFQATNVTGGHPDFEYVIADDRGITTAAIGADGKPAYGNHPSGTTTTHGQAYFDQWYNDDKTVNRSFIIALKMIDRSNVRSFQADTFFPLDNQGFGNTATYSHNYHFTTEIHTAFTYGGGETFTFIGDDDVFVYINDQLVIDLGGVHNAETTTVNLDSLGLTAGQVYPIAIFQAERHAVQSHFRFDSTLAFANCGEIPPGVVVN